MQVSALSTDVTADVLAGDLYAVVTFLHQHCNHDLFAAVGELDLTLTQIKLLHQFEEADRELALTEAAELVHVSLPAASRTVEDLVRRGLVERREDGVDRRIKRVRLTAGGHAVIRRLNGARLAGLERFAATLEPGEREAVAVALRTLTARPAIAACRPEDHP